MIIRTDIQRRIAKYMLEEGDDLGTTNPHYTATEVNVSDSAVKGFFRKLRDSGVLQTEAHPEGGRCIDPDTRALVLNPGPNFTAFVDEGKMLGFDIDSNIPGWYTPLDPAFVSDDARRAIWWAVNDYPKLDVVPPLASDEEVASYKTTPKDLRRQVRDYLGEREWV